MGTTAWPELPVKGWSDTYATLHLWSQVVGKVALALAPTALTADEVTTVKTTQGLEFRIGDAVVTTDLLAEGTHFVRSETSLARIGRTLEFLGAFREGSNEVLRYYDVNVNVGGPIKVVPAGHVGVKDLFGRVSPMPRWLMRSGATPLTRRSRLSISGHNSFTMSHTPWTKSQSCLVISRSPIDAPRKQAPIAQRVLPISDSVRSI